MVSLFENMLYMVPLSGLVALAFGYLFYRDIFSRGTGNDEMRSIYEAIKDGAMAYLTRQYKTIGIISVIVAVLIILAGDVFGVDRLGWEVALAFLLGAGFSALSGFIGMYVAVNSNIRTADAARSSLKEAFHVSFRGGAISGIAVAALSLLGVFTLFMVFEFLAEGATIAIALEHVVGYAFGASMAALFAQLGGGIYTKAADVGADLVGKVEAGIPEDDPRNPAVIADLVGDNVGDCAGRGADLFESTAAEIIGAMIIGYAVYKVMGSAPDELVWIMFPLVFLAFGLISSLIGIWTVKMKEEGSSLHSTLNRGYMVTAGLSLVSLVFISHMMLDLALYPNLWIYFLLLGIIGVVLGIVIVYITQYYTAGSYRPVRDIAEASETGPATNIISGISIGLETTVLPVLAICLALGGSFGVGWFIGADVIGLTAATDLFVFGLYGTAIATIAMLCSSAFILAEDTFGPITDNAGGIVEMSDLDSEVRVRTDMLDSAGNTTKALTKGYAMATAGLAAFLLFAAYFEIVADVTGQSLLATFDVSLGNPMIFIGGLIGGMLVFIFSALAIKAVGVAAFDMINEVRRQFREYPGIMEGTEKPRYGECVDIATKGALRAMVVPGLLPILFPVVFGLICVFILQTFAPEYTHIAPQAVGALIIVGTMVGILMANFFNNGGGAWDNAKKYIEEGNHGGKGSPAHAAAVVGDTVGDPFKDTAGPSIHVLVKLLSTVTLVTARLYIV